MVQNDRRGWFEFLSTLIPFILAWIFAVMAYNRWGIIGSLPFSLINMGLMVRFFILMHDYGHGASFKTPFWRNLMGHLCGFFTLTPYWQWTHDHAVHHQTIGNLDRRGLGDIWTATVEEYSAMNSRAKTAL